MTFVPMRTLERYLAGEADDAERRRVEEAREQDPALSRWLAERQDEREALAGRRRNFRALVARAESEHRHRILWIALPVTAVAAVAVVALALLPARSRRVDHPAVAVRGGVSVRIAAQDDEGGTRVIASGARLHPGARLRLSIDDPLGGWVTVLLEEQSGGVQVVYAPDESGRLGPGTHVLPGSLELDAALGRERLYVILTPERPALDGWVREIGAEHARAGFDHDWLPAGAQARLSIFEYEKVPP